MISSEYTKRIKARILKLGADLVGVADAEPLKALKVNPPGLLHGFSRAVSIAIQIPASIFEAILDKPTPDYNQAYQTVNQTLDELALRASALFQKDRFRSITVPASQILDRENWHAAISHKAVARMAGLGWLGKNLLLITPQFGPRVRLATILTEAPLQADVPMKNRCGNCRSCQDACPAEAIRGASTTGHYKDREEALLFSRCVEKLTAEYAKLPGIGVPICGICIKACPFGRRKQEANTK